MKYFTLGRTKRKGVFEHAGNTQIEIHPAHAQSLFRARPPLMHSIVVNNSVSWQLTADSEKKGKRKVQGVPQSQTAALPRPQEEEETDKSKQAQTE